MAESTKKFRYLNVPSRPRLPTRLTINQARLVRRSVAVSMRGPATKSTSVENQISPRKRQSQPA